MCAVWKGENIVVVTTQSKVISPHIIMLWCLRCHHSIATAMRTEGKGNEEVMCGWKPDRDPLRWRRR